MSIDPAAPPRYRVVPASRVHVEAIAPIEQAAATRFPHEDLPVELRYMVTDYATLREAQGAGRLWVAVDERDRPVGFALAEELADELYLCEMDVLPDHGQRGIGTQLVEAVIAWARLHEFPALSLITFRHLPWNAPFYAKLGFQPLSSADLGTELAGFLAEEAEVGIDPSKRIGMRLQLVEAADDSDMRHRP